MAEAATNFQRFYVTKVSFFDEKVCPVGTLVSIDINAMIAHPLNLRPESEGPPAG